MTPDKTRQEASVTVGALGDLPASPRAAGYWLGLIAIVPLLLLLLTDISFYLTKLKLSLPLKLTPIPLAMGYLQECEIVLVQAVSKSTVSKKRVLSREAPWQGEPSQLQGLNNNATQVNWCSTPSI